MMIPRRLFVALCTIAGLVGQGLVQAAEPVRVQVVDKAGFEKALAAHHGKVVLVDCWATWCVPCIRAFPKTVELHKAHAKDGLVVMSFCFDELDNGQAPAKVHQFLTDQGGNFPHLISKLDLGDEGADAFQIEDGALPHFKLYDTKGKLIRVFSSSDEDNPFKHEDIEAAILAALRQ